MEHVLIAAVAFLAAGITFFSGFGLGTVLMPVFAVFFPVPVAIAITAVVHFLNNLFKLALVRRHIEPDSFWRFGLPAVLAACLGAALLARLAEWPALWDIRIMGLAAQGTPLKLAVGLLLLAIVPLELKGWTPDARYRRRWLYVGGFLSGFFGGLSGNQGAFRSAALLKAGLSKEHFIGTGVALACVVDATRLLVYGARTLGAWEWKSQGALTAIATVSAFAGAFLANRLLKKVALRGIQILVAILLTLIALGLATGVL